MADNPLETLGRWYDEQARPLLAKHLPDKVAGIDEALERIKALDRNAGEDLPICFLGTSGVGKSTLINALVGGREIILPAGGIGPLTAIAMEVRYGEQPAFEAEYHSAKHLWQAIGFPLEAAHMRALKKAAASLPDVSVLPEYEAVGAEEMEPPESMEDEADKVKSRARLEYCRKQAQLIVKGSQDIEADLPYLVDCVRDVAGMKRLWGTVADPEDMARLNVVREALAIAKAGRRHRRESGGDTRALRMALQDHASGFLAPLIKELQVWWPSDLLRSGMALVDLPGVGVSGDIYKQATHKWITERAKVVVLVVSKSGISEESAELLRTSDFLTRLLFSYDDAAHDPVTLAVAVSRLDDVAEEEWAKNRDKKKAQYLEDQFGAADSLVRSQVRQVLQNVWESSDEALMTAKKEIIDKLRDGLLVFPVSAPQYRRVLTDDDDDRAFIREEVQSGVPAMIDGLRGLVVTRREEAFRRRDAAIGIWKDLVIASIDLLHAQWSEGEQSSRELERLEHDLESFVAPMRKEFLVRQGIFREFLKATMPGRIETLVLRAKDRAEREINDYLWRLRLAHWGTLRAAVRRDGTFYGSRYINLPDDFTQRFVEPIAEVWGKSIIQDIRKRTREFAENCEGMVLELATWCRGQGTRVSPRLLEAQIGQLKADIKMIDVVGKDVINGLRDKVKNDLAAAVRKPIRGRCTAFVKRGDDIGPGVKNRILEMFDELGEECANKAAEVATNLLLESFENVRVELDKIRRNLENPLDTATDAILQAHRKRTERSDAKQRAAVLEECHMVMDAAPDIVMTGQAESLGS